MKTNELRKPLIQTGVVLAAIVFLISMVGGSETTSFFGMIGSILSGILHTVLLIIGLAIALVFSIACLIGIFFGAVALYSVEDTKRLFGQFLENCMRLKANCTCSEYTPGSCASSEEKIEPTALQTEEVQSTEATSPAAAEEITATPPAVEPVVVKDSKEIEELRAKLDSGLSEIHALLADIKKKESSIEESISDLSLQIAGKADAELSEKLSGIVESQEKANTASADNNKRLDGIESSLSEQSTAATDLVKKINDLQKSVKAANGEINQLQELVTSPSVVEAQSEAEEDAADEEHRIFSYLENEKDRLLFSSKIEEAIQKDMTYAEIDTFLTESLSKAVDAIIKDHPSLTKDYIRLNKKQA